MAGGGSRWASKYLKIFMGPNPWLRVTLTIEVANRKRKRKQKRLGNRLKEATAREATSPSCFLST